MTVTPLLQFGLLAAAVLLASALGAWIVQRAALRSMQTWFAAALAAQVDRLGRELRQAVDASGDRASMQIGSRVAQLQDALTSHVTQITGIQAEQLGQVRSTLETRLQALQQGNEARLEQMRATVEEKLQTTLEGKLGESFRLVSERLEQVHKGLGEMQALAAGVGDLKRVLGNVKSRGVFGEVQLAGLLEQVLLADQYAANVPTRPGSTERVDFAIRLPGRNGGSNVWLPIDAKFPTADYERMVAAQERADSAGAEEAARALEDRVRLEARTLREKYVEPPHTTDFAVLFLPTEGLFAEVLRRPGLSDELTRERRVVVAGPTTLYAMLNTLQMGFRTLAIEQRSAEVWQVLGAVKTEFARFGDWLGRIREQVGTVSRTLELADARTRQMQRRLRDVEALPAEQAIAMLPEAPREDEDE